MAVPLIQIGQCGNQVGQAFYNAMFEEGQRSSPAHQALLSQFFDQGHVAKAMLIDMEPKVVTKCLNKGGAWKYNRETSLVRQQGSGNNWAYGCYVHGPKVKEDLESLFRKIVQPQDYINSFLQIQSLAGGTGSGLGTFVLSLLNDLYPKTPKFVTCVLPHLSGEVILQAYNASLSLGTTYGLADGIFLLQNDTMNKICVEQLNIKKPQLENINKIIARSLSSMLFPVIPKNSSYLCSIQQNHFDYGQDLIQQIFFDNRYKLASLKCAPHSEAGSQKFQSDSWISIQNQLLLRSKQTRARLFIGRGQDHPSASQTQGVPSIYDRHSFYQFDRSGVLIENGQNCTSSLQKIVQRAYGMLIEKAYLYQYQKYGVEGQHFQQCLSVMENIQNCYSKLK